MDLARFPRRRYTQGSTPLYKMERLSAYLGGPSIYVKRDDLLGLAGGGNKTRKLEFVVAEAMAQKADTLITCGAVQSNHCRLTLAAAAVEGMRCRLVLEERVPGSYKEGAAGNNLLFQLLGAERIRVVPGGSDMEEALQREAEKARQENNVPYTIPGGASFPLGALGYAACVQELMAQTFDQGLVLDAMVTASGSGGTHAGLLTGLIGFNLDLPVLGINVSRTTGEQEDLILALAEQTLAHLGIGSQVPRDRVRCFDDYVGSGYSLPTPEMVQAVRLLARTEGILLDPVYSGKAMAGLIDLIQKGYFARNHNVLFLHTGGAQALHAYSGTFLQGADEGSGSE